MKFSTPLAITVLIDAAALCAVLAPTANAAQPLEERRPKVVTEWARAWNGTDCQALGSLFTADGTCTDQAVGVTLHGRQEIAGWKAHAGDLVDGVRATVRAAYRDGDRIAVEAVYAGHLKGVLKPFAAAMAALLDPNTRRQITSGHAYYSPSTVLAESGLPAGRTPPSR